MWNNVRWVTGRPLTAPPHSAIRLHCEQVHDVPVKADNFSIIDSTQNTVSLRILESLYIQKLKPELNDTNNAFPLNIVKYNQSSFSCQEPIYF